MRTELRFLLAMGLMLVVLVGTNVLFPPAPPEEPVPEQPVVGAAPETPSIRSAEPADLNGDGLVDLAVIEERTGGTAILWGRRDGTWTDAEPLGTGKAVPYALALADVDRNGRVDVIVGHVESRPVVYFNDGAQGFSPVPFGDDTGTAYGFAVSDLDGDGYQDIALARSGARSMLYFGFAAKPGPP